MKFPWKNYNKILNVFDMISIILDNPFETPLYNVFSLIRCLQSISSDPIIRADEYDPIRYDIAFHVRLASFLHELKILPHIVFSNSSHCRL